MTQLITHPERVTQNEAVRLLQSVLDYRYLGNLADTENSNIRVNDLRRFLIEKQNCTEAMADEAIMKLREAAQCSQYRDLYNKGLEVYRMLRYGVSVSQGYNDVNTTVQFINWNDAGENDFAVAEEVTVRRVTEDLRHRRPDMVVYVNGIALVVLELKRMSVSVANAIRQNRRNQQDNEICHFFTTVQLIMAGNESEGLKYGVTKTPEEFWLKWKEPTGDPCSPSRFTVQEFPNEMFRSLLQMLEPGRLLEFIHDCIIYDGGIKKAARPNQYFALAAAKERVRKNQGGIIWHSQGAGKSLTMVWLAQWIQEQPGDNRILIVTDRDELDRQIETGFKNTNQTPKRVRSGRELVDAIRKPGNSVLTTLIHKFGLGLHDATADRITVSGKKATRSAENIMEAIARSLPEDFAPAGNFYVFVDECHRTQGGVLHKAMKQIMGDKVMMIGFTGTPLLKKNKLTTLEQFGSFIHTYKFDEAVRDGVILDLQYEARNVEQAIEESDKEKIDRMFDARTIGLGDRAKEALKKRWATLQKLYSSHDRMQRIVANVCEDMVLLSPLVNGHGNAMLVAGDVYQAYRYWNMFQQTPELHNHVAVVTSYDPALGISIEDGYSDDSQLTEEEFKQRKAQEMMGDMDAVSYEQWAKKQFIDNPNDMKLLIVVDKLLTGFDAPKATFLYIDKHMEDHNLFQAICRVNRKSEDWKEFGYIIDYKDLFNEIHDAIEGYTSGKNENALSGFSDEDVDGLLKNRLEESKKALDAALEELENYVQFVKEPKGADQYFDFFCWDQATTPAEEQQAVSLENANKREGFYNLVQKLTNRYLAIATQMVEAGYTVEQAERIHQTVLDYAELRDAIMLRSGDMTDLKQYNSMMRQLLDRYVKAPRSEVLAKLEDFTFLELIETEKDAEQVADELTDGGKDGEPSVAETIASNIRHYIVRKRDTNPEYFDKLSDKLNKLLEEYRQKAIDYRTMLVQLLMTASQTHGRASYPRELDTPLKRALYDNLDKDVELALGVYDVVENNAQDNWRELKARRLRLSRAVGHYTGFDDDRLNALMGIIASNEEFQ